MSLTPAEANPHEKSILTAAVESLTKRHDDALAKADATAQRLGYDVAKDPSGNYQEIIETLRIERAVADAIREDVQLVGGYVTGLFVIRHAD